MNILPWTEKYRPTQLNEIYQSNQLTHFFQNISENNLPHCLFYGPSGVGKTSTILAIGRKIFGEHYHSRVIEFNASNERGISAVREKITNEAKKNVSKIISNDNKQIPGYKIIILDEADSMTDEAQDALRVIIEQYSDVTRFCFICNYISKITDAIKSRCSLVYFKRLDGKCTELKLNEIAIKEGMQLPHSICATVIQIANGDMRKAIMLLQSIKYLYDYRQSVSQPINCQSMLQWSTIENVAMNIQSTTIDIDDVYQIASSISPAAALIIIDQIVHCQSVNAIRLLSKQLIATGRSIDNFFIQINDALLLSKRFTETQKCQIICYSGNIFYRMKECADEYIQLLHYLTIIYTVFKTGTIDKI